MHLICEHSALATTFLPLHKRYCFHSVDMFEDHCYDLRSGLALLRSSSAARTHRLFRRLIEQRLEPSISVSGCLWSLLASTCRPSGSLQIDWTSLNERGCVTIVDPADGVDCGVVAAAVSPTLTEAALGTHTIAVLGLVWGGVAQIRTLLVVWNYADVRIHVGFAASDGSPSDSRR